MPSQQRHPSRDGVYLEDSSFSTHTYMRRKQASLSSVAVPSFSAAFQAQASSVSTGPAVRRKPLPPKARPVAPRYHSADGRSHGPAQATDIPLIHRAAASIDAPQTTSPFAPRDLDKYPRGTTPLIPHARTSSLDSPNTEGPATSEVQAAAGVQAQKLFLPVRPRLTRQGTSWHTALDGVSDDEGQSDQEGDGSSGAAFMTSHASGAPHLRLHANGVERNSEINSDGGHTTTRPRSPVQRLTSLFGWKSSSSHNGNSSPSTPFSDRSLSRGPSPVPADVLTNGTRLSEPEGSLSLLPSQHPHPDGKSYNIHPTGVSQISPVPDMSYAMELERELREVCAELASSVRREMDLEDEIDRRKSEMPMGLHEGNRQTSDYFSDSGLNSLRHPFDDGDSKLEELERLRRKAEQERADLRVEMGHRIQKELRRRKQLEAHIHDLENQMQITSKGEQSFNGQAERVRSLELSLEDIRRRYQEERHLKENYEDLLTAMQQEIEEHRTQRDNLRDEVVPQLRLRLEAFETEVAKSDSMVYEDTRMRQELQSMRDEHQALLAILDPPLFSSEPQHPNQSDSRVSKMSNLTGHIRRLQEELHIVRREKQDLLLSLENQDVSEESISIRSFLNENGQLKLELASLRSSTGGSPGPSQRPQPLDLHRPPLSAGFDYIAEEDDLPQPGPLSPKVGLTRSNSLARISATRGSGRKLVGRSNTVRERDGTEAPEHVPDRLKDIEHQRDALHDALKSLLQRHRYQDRENSKKIRELQVERDMALNRTSRRMAFNTEVQHLRSEVNYLRHRADEALEQKWQCEKGLSGLKMDLDRAQQETSSLRLLLQEQNILIPQVQDFKEYLDGPSLEEQRLPVSLERAYIELQTTYALSLALIVDMDKNVNGPRPIGAEAQRTLELLKLSLSDAEVERDNAHCEAEQYRQQALALRKSELDHFDQEQSLPAQLYASAKRMDELASSVQRQIELNHSLRQRLAEAVDKGESEQKTSTARIVKLQGNLKLLEDRAAAAQQHSEESVTKHEDEMMRVKQSDSPHLSRVKIVRLSSVVMKPLSAHVGSPSTFAFRSPRFDQTTSEEGTSIAEASRTATLQKRVEELERALADADLEMQEVISRMNKAQIEVIELQTERDEGIARTKRLYDEIFAERGRMKGLVS